MPGLATNVLVRWLVEDDDRHVARAKTLFETAGSQHTTFFVPVTVMLELEWVLRSRYGFEKSTALDTYSALLESQELEFLQLPSLQYPKATRVAYLSLQNRENQGRAANREEA